jgi:hypothetical protein
MTRTEMPVWSATVARKSPPFSASRVALVEAPELRQRLQRGVHRGRGERTPIEAARPEPHHLLLPIDHLEGEVRPHLNDDHVDRVRADVDGGQPHAGSDVLGSVSFYVGGLILPCRPHTFCSG